MNTDFYNQMVKIKRQKECSIRELAKECNLCYGTLIEFYNTDKPFRPLREQTMAKLNNHLGISYDIMEDYNKVIMNEREG